MLLFDNIYYLLYTYFKRTNFGKWGYKSTAIIATSFYLFFSIIIFFSSIKVGCYFFKIKNELSTFALSNKCFWWGNETILIATSIMSYFVLSIRYCNFRKYEQIHENKCNMQFRKRKLLDDLTILFLIISPFLMYFLLDFTKIIYS
jgi:hypothetical protein